MKLSTVDVLLRLTLIFLFQIQCCYFRELSQDSDGSRNRLSRRFGLVDELTTIPDIDPDTALTQEVYELIKDYLDKVI